MIDKETVLARLNVETFYRSADVRFIGQPNGQGELKAHCPFGTHEDRHPSASFNIKPPGLYKCHACGHEGDIFTFCQVMYDEDFPACLKRLADFTGLTDGVSKPTPSLNHKPKQATEPELVSLEQVETWVEALLHDDGRLRELEETYSLIRQTVADHHVGFDGNYFTIPLPTTLKDGKLAVKRHRRGQEPKARHPANVTAQLFGAETLEDAPNGSLVIVTGGEFKRLLLVQMGFLAVSGTAGEGTFLPEWAEPFRGKNFNVVILYDVDGKSEAGIKKAVEVLQPVVKTLRPVRLPLPGTPDAKDVTDYIKAGHTGEELHQLIQQTPVLPSVEQAGADFSEPASVLLAEPDEPVDWLIEPLIERESLGFIGGEPKQTKSILALHLAFCAVTGQSFIGKYNVPKPLTILYVQEEDSRRMVKRRLKAFVRASGLPSNGPSSGFEDRLRVAIRQGFRIDEPDWYTRLQVELETFKPDLVIFDVLANLHGLDENDQRDMSKLMKLFQELRGTYHCAVILVHHFKKTSREGGFIQPNQRLRGSSVLAAASENSFYLSSQPDKLIRLDHESKDGPVEPFVYAIEGSLESKDGMRLVHRGEAGAAAKLAKADTFYTQLCHQFDTVHEEGCTVTALSKALGMSKNTVRSLIKLLLAQRRVQEGEVMVTGKDEKQRKTPCFLPILSESSTGEDVEE